MQRPRVRAALARILLLAGALACEREGAEPPPVGAGPEGEAAALAPAERARAAVGAIDDAKLAAADAAADDWLSYGRTYREQRYSPLDQITERNVAELGLAWWLDAQTTRGLEATPLVVDGILYTTGSWSVVFAVDARTGTLLWKYDPQVPRQFGQKPCCDVVNRGVALYRGRVYVGTIDGRLVALDAATGKVDWEVVTVDQSKPYTITGAPRAVKGKVLIGNGGAELGVRGYVSAYDAATGALVWRFYTVPGDPSLPFESAALERAAKTWTGEWWKIGGGGTVWDSIVYDPELDLLYVGTGNGSPWSRHVRSPGGGDNLYLSSILALRPDTGELVWHYQTTPGDTWDFTATQHILLADLEIEGARRKVLMQAPKNGFFYVLERATGKLLSAKPFATVTWAKGIDLATGRPIETETARYQGGDLIEVKPAPFGAHNWHPMSYSPKTGLVYIPVNEVPFFFRREANFRFDPGTWNVGVDPDVADSFPRELTSGHLLAWDPVAQREAWRVPYPTPWNGGTLATAGNLVFQGTATGRFAAYRATDGKKLFEAPAGTGIIAAPMTYRVDGTQYVAVMAGWGGAFALSAGDAAEAAGVTDNAGRLLVFALGGAAKLPEPKAAPQEIAPIPVPADPALVKSGKTLYARSCFMCHGFAAEGGGVLPDLRKSAPEVLELANLKAIVLHGAYLGRGMPNLSQWVTEADLVAIRAYVLSRRAELLAERTKAGAEGG
jgi:quinohemoprotein ethanol dehydrogenase